MSPKCYAEQCIVNAEENSQASDPEMYIELTKYIAKMSHKTC